MDFFITKQFKYLVLVFFAGLNSLAQGQSIAQGLLYSLPKSEFILAGTIRTTTYTPGPLAAYAKKYLGISVNEQPDIIHTILQSRLILNLMPDTSCMFLVSGSALQNNQFHFGRGATLLSVNSTTPTLKPLGNLPEKLSPNATASDLPPLPFLHLTQEIDTIYRRELLADSVVVEHWEIQTLIQQQTAEEIAKNTAQKLVKLEQDRQQLIRFNEDVQYAGDALRVMLQRLDSLENYYHELFQGQQSHKITYFSFPIALSNADLHELQTKGNLTKIIARFSTTNGFSSDSTQSTPVFLSMQTAGIPRAIQRFQIEKRSKPDDGLIVRIPERCNIQISVGKTGLIRENHPLFQLGSLLRLPIPKSGRIQYSIWSEIGHLDFVEW